MFCYMEVFTGYCYRNVYLIMCKTQLNLTSQLDFLTSTGLVWSNTDIL